MVPRRPRFPTAIAAVAALGLLMTACEYRPLRHEKGAVTVHPISSASTLTAPPTEPTNPNEGIQSDEPTQPPPAPAGGQLGTLAGSDKGYAEGTGAAAKFGFPVGIAVDASGTVFVSDTENNRVRKIAPDGTTTLLAGSGAAGGLDGPGIAAQFNHPRGIAVDDGGTVYVADTGNNKIRSISPDGTVTTIAGSGKLGYKNAPGTKAMFASPIGIAVGAGNTLYVSDFQNNVIRRIQAQTYLVTTLAGSTQAGYADGAGAAAKFNSPFGVATDAAGNVYVADTANERIRRVTPDGTVSTVSGGEAGFTDGRSGARFSSPEGVATAPDGSLYVADFGNNAVRRIDPKGRVTTLAGNGAGYAEGPTSTAKLDHPEGIAFGRSGVIYIADSSNNRIRTLKTS